MSRDAEFTSKVKGIIAKRAGYRCSLPYCGKLTIGPGKDDDTVDNTGIAAHIYSASSEEGPRGTGGLSEEERRSHKNGIWLCGIHGTYIDANKGSKYPASLLKSYKALHEARIEREQSGIRGDMGWIQEISISTSPVIKNNSKIRFSKVNLFLGNNATGKSTVADWIATISDFRYLESATRYFKRNGHPLSFSLRYFNPDEIVVSVSIDRQGIRMIHNEIELATLAAPIQVQYMREEFRYDKEDPVGSLAVPFGVHKNQVPVVLKHMNSNECLRFRDVYIESDEKREWLMFTDSKGRSHEFAGLSSSEIQRFFVEFGITLAKASARLSPTLLILDCGITSVDHKGIRFYAEYLASDKCPFQSIFILPRSSEKLESPDWVVTKFIGKIPEVELLQDSFLDLKDVS